LKKDGQMLDDLNWPIDTTTATICVSNMQCIALHDLCMRQSPHTWPYPRLQNKQAKGRAAKMPSVG
jgi:hypothetical protein